MMIGCHQKVYGDGVGELVQSEAFDIFSIDNDVAPSLCVLCRLQIQAEIESEPWKLLPILPRVHDRATIDRLRQTVLDQQVQLNAMQYGIDALKDQEIVSRRGRKADHPKKGIYNVI